MKPSPQTPDSPFPRSLTLAATATVEVTAAADGSNGPSLPRFRMVAYTGGPMRIAGWRYPVVLDLAGLSIPSQARPIRFGHDPLSGVGHTDLVRVEAQQLIAAGVVSRDTPAARDVVASAKNGFPWQASVGTSVEEVAFTREGETVFVNGRSLPGPLNVVRKSTLGEISFVDLGADGNTSALVAGAPSGDHDVNPNETSAPPASSSANSTVPAAPSPAPASPAPVAAGASTDEIRAQAAAETERIAAIRRICSGRFSEIEAQAIREGWDATKCELHVLRAGRPQVLSVASSEKPVTAHVLEAACLMTAGIPNLERQYADQALDLAAKRFRGGIGLQELLLEAAWANGYTGRNFRDHKTVLRFAFGRNLEAGFSTIDIGGILSNVANKFLLEGFFSVERTWRNICAVRNVRDFKTVSSYRLVGKDQYELVAPGGEIKHGTLGDERYSNRADTYALMLSIDRRDIINDDLGAITTVPRKLGRGSGLKINDVFWTTFLANAAFFNVGHKNFLSGAATALGIDGLTAGEVAFLDQTDSDGKPIGILPAVLLVPTALGAIGSQLHKSAELRDTTPNAKYPVTNPHQGKFRTEVSRYLGNAQYPGASAKAWYLLADANDLPVIEVAFLNGQEAPTIETADADFSVLGVQMRGFHDFGIALQDFRGGVKAKGEA